MWNSNLSFPFPFLVKHIQLLELSLFLTRNARTWICWCCRLLAEYHCFYHLPLIPLVLTPVTSGKNNLMIHTRWKQITIFQQVISVINIIFLPVSELPGSRHIFGCAELELIVFMNNCESVFETTICPIGYMLEPTELQLAQYSVLMCRQLLMQVFVKWM